MLKTSSFPAPHRLFPPGCALAAGLLWVTPLAQAAPAAPSKNVVAPQTLRVGKTASYPMTAGMTFTIESGALHVYSEMSADKSTLTVKALSAGVVRLRLNKPGQNPEFIALDFVTPHSEPDSIITSEGFGSSPFSPATPTTQMPAADAPLSTGKAINRVSSQVVERAPTGGGLPQPAPFGPVPAAGTPASANGAISGVGAGAATLFPPEFGGQTASNTSTIPANPTPAQQLPPQTFAPATSAPTVQLTPQTTPQTTLNPSRNQLLGEASRTQTAIGTPNSVTNGNAVGGSAVGGSSIAGNFPAGTTAPALNTAPDGGARISPALPAPAPGLNAGVTYKTTPKLPPSINQVGAKQSVQVTQGMARLLTFRNNILSVFFSDPNAMDARAINARTIAVTGTGLGQSTLAVFTERFPGDVVGYASVYRVDTLAKNAGTPIAESDPATIEAALSAALGDPRIRVSVFKLADKTLAARLTGVVRNEAEVQGALTTASLFGARVLPSVYADVNAPSIEAVLSGAASQTPESTLQDNLRRITGNPSIELIAMPGSLILKAQADSQEEAQQILQLLPSLNRAVLPFVTIRGGGTVETSSVPLLQGEDLQLTQKLQAVTGVRTVYAVRASGNSIAIYGNVPSRSEYEAVKRYGLIVAQSSLPIAPQGTAQGGSVFRPQGGEPPPLPAYDPAAGYARQLGVQMFVRITDPEQSAIRNVTIETNIVEITRTSLQNLGAEYGSATLLTELSTPGTRTPQLNADGNPIFDTKGNQLFNTTGGTIRRTIDPGFNPGSILAGNGFLGQGGIGAINPYRARINAIAQKNNARVLASPNIRATEGTVAQITIGGERPVPTASASFGSNAQSIEFRRFGVILTMRPTVNDDNSIILQIRADVTQPDQTYAINVAGAIIPGESVRSIDTTITVRPGDIVVMGGLLTNDKRQQTSKVPILGDIPILGALFRSKRYENNETELAIFMTPRIDAVPATMAGIENLGRTPSFPALPGRQETTGSIFQNTARPSG